MRKAFLAALLPALMLISCTRDTGIAPEVVLEKTVVASQSLQSARFEGAVKFQNMNDYFPADAGSLTFDGVMKDGGKQLSFVFDIEGETPEGENLRIGGDVRALGEDETYFLINALALPGDEKLSADLQAMLHTWWLLPRDEEKEGNGALSPDPRFLRMQAEVVEVMKDRGMTRENGNDVIHYEVALQKEKLAAFLKDALPEDEATGDNDALALLMQSIDATGDLWIDAQTYMLRRIRWDLSVKEQAFSPRIEMTVSFDDYGLDAEISPPQDSMPFSSELLNTLLSSPTDVNGKPMTEIYSTD